MFTISIFEFDYNKVTNCLTQEISILQYKGYYPKLIHSLKEPESIQVFNPNTNNSQIFDFIRKDMDGSNEDIYGWRYKSKEGTKLLIIND